MFETVQVPNFSLKRKFWTIGPNKNRTRYFQSKKEKIENHQRILNIRITPRSKFQPQQTILTFLEQIYPKN